MLYGFVGRVTRATSLKEALDISTQRTRVIADRVAKASLVAPGGFALPVANARPESPAEGPIDLEAEMVSLADEQIRFEATAKLLERAYRGVRASLRDR